MTAEYSRSLVLVLFTVELFSLKLKAQSLEVSFWLLHYVGPVPIEVCLDLVGKPCGVCLTITLHFRGQNCKHGRKLHLALLLPVIVFFKP